ncbi:MAG: four helix bundle protein [Bacteroidetes bacterium]|nr:four helix bundle protein [Bacteroidota bacterium]
MEKSGTPSFNEVLRNRTYRFAIDIHDMFNDKKIALLNRSPVNQLFRSSSSVAANFRAATRARSDGEYYAKICIVTEECDETQFWLDFNVDIKVIEELIKIFTTIKKKVRDRLENSKK